METANTCTSNKASNLTLKDLCLCQYKLEDKKTSIFDFPKISWFTRRMNKMGWHREPTVYVIDMNKFKISGLGWN